MPSASAAPLLPPKKPTKNYSYDFYFDIDLTKATFVDNCIRQTVTRIKSGSFTWKTCNDDNMCKKNAKGIPCNTKDGGFDKPTFFPDKNSLIPINNTWFTGWNIANAKITYDSSCNGTRCYPNSGGACNQQSCSGQSCIGWQGVISAHYKNDSYCPCNAKDGSVQNNSVTAYYDCYQPTSYYWYSSANIVPDAEPTVFLIEPVDNTTQPISVTYKVTYTIGFPNIISSDEIDAFITKVGQFAFSPTSITKSSDAAQQLVLDYCNNNGDSVTSKMCKPQKNIMEYFKNSTQNPINVKYGCDTSYTNCQQGWMNYCDDPKSFTSTECQNFYASSYTPTATINSNVQALLQRNCAKTSVTNGVVNSPLSPDLQSVCGCYLPQGVYDDFKSTITKNNPGLASFFSTPQCYYPMCNTNLSLQPNKAASAVCPSNTITQCITNTTNNLNAGGNISNVQVQNNAVQNCAASASEGSPAVKTNATPVSSVGAATPVVSTPATPAAATPAFPATASAPTPALTPASTPAPEKGGLCIIL